MRLNEQHIIRAHWILTVIKIHIISWDYIVTDDITSVSHYPHGVSTMCTPTILWSFRWTTFQCPHTDEMTSLFFSPLLTLGRAGNHSWLSHCWMLDEGSPLLPAKCSTYQTKGSCSGSEQTPGLEWPRSSNLMFGMVITFLCTEDNCHERQRTVQRLYSGTKIWKPGHFRCKKYQVQILPGFSSHCLWWGGWWLRWKAVLLELWSFVQGALPIGELLNSWES